MLARPSRATDPIVVSVAGGAVLLDRRTGRCCARRHRGLVAGRPGHLADRVGDGAGRRCSGDDPASALAAL